MIFCLNNHGPVCRSRVLSGDRALPLTRGGGRGDYKCMLINTIHSLLHSVGSFHSDGLCVAFNLWSLVTYPPR